MKKAFTLLELLVVIIIIAILVGIAYGTYRGQMEKGRSAEAYANLATLRKLAMLYYYEHGDFPVASSSTNDINTNLPLGSDGACLSSEYYFNYECQDTGVCVAHRCTAGGRSPTRPSGMDYNYTIDAASGNITPDGDLP